MPNTRSKTAAIACDEYRGTKRMGSIVPISLTAPKHDLPFNVRLSKNYHPLEEDDLPCWAKCDLLLNLGIWRLDGFKVGRRKWDSPQLTAEDLSDVKRGVLFGLGMGHLCEG